MLPLVLHMAERSGELIDRIFYLAVGAVADLDTSISSAQKPQELELELEYLRHEVREVHKVYSVVSVSGSSMFLDPKSPRA